MTKDIQSTDLAMPKIFSEDVTVLFSGFIARGYAAMLCFFFLTIGDVSGDPHFDFMRASVFRQYGKASHSDISKPFP